MEKQIMLLAGCLLYNTAFRPYDIVHNLKHPLTGKRQAHTVRYLPSFGEARVYAKEEALLDLLNAELSAGRACVVYVRQTQTRDIQPRLEALIREHVPLAQPFILKNTVAAERREALIEAEVAKGVNVLIANPELTKTGLDLVFATTLIFYEITFALGTMMQAAARSYRLNQTSDLCKVVYMFAEGTMEHSAVQLMSRKQRAAKLLVGDVGLSGLEALTQGENGLEEALLDALGHEERLLNPSDMFKDNSASSELDAEDAAYWAGQDLEEGDTQAHEERILQLAEPVSQAIDSTSERSIAKPVEFVSQAVDISPERSEAQTEVSLNAYLEQVSLIRDAGKFKRLQEQVLRLIYEGIRVETGGIQAVQGIQAVASLPEARQALQVAVSAWLKAERFVFPQCVDEVAARLLELAERQASPLSPSLTPAPTQTLKAQAHRSAPAKRKAPDLSAIPDELLEIVSRRAVPVVPKVSHQPAIAGKPEQLALL